MAGREVVMQLLDECGAQYLGHSGNNHPKYRLPNRRVLTLISGASCDYRSWDNCLARLRRELTDTHPNLSRVRPNHPSKSRRGGVSLGDLLTAKAVNPQSFDIHLQAEFEIEEGGPAEDMSRPEHRSPRLKKDPPPRPGAVRTVSPEQLAHYNVILHSEGETAANAYLADCRSGLVACTRELQKERMPPPAPLGPLTITVAQKEEAIMRELVRRSKVELGKRQARIVKAKELLETDETAALELDYFITDAERVLAQVPAILTLLPSIAEATPVAAAAPVEMPKRAGNQGKKLVRMETVIRLVLPALAHQTWDTTTFYSTLGKSLPGQDVPLKTSVPAMLTKLLKAEYIERISFGVYAVKDRAAVAA